MRYEGACTFKSISSFLYNKKECALAHSRAEARLPRQPSTLAPSAHPRRAFIIVWKQSFLYDKNESCEAGFSACGGSRKRHSSIPLQCDPRSAFIIVWKRSFLYDNKRAVAQQNYLLMRQSFIHDNRMLAERAFYCFSLCGASLIRMRRYQPS